jgi:hypothetical protein
MLLPVSALATLGGIGAATAGAMLVAAAIASAATLTEDILQARMRFPSLNPVQRERQAWGGTQRNP